MDGVGAHHHRRDRLRGAVARLEHGAAWLDLGPTSDASLRRCYLALFLPHLQLLPISRS